MTELKVGDRVRAKYPTFDHETSGTIADEHPRDGFVTVRWEGYQSYLSPEDGHDYGTDELDLVDGETDATNPSHYAFPGGAEVIDISQWLTSNAAQALQYIARSSRIDGKNKGDTVEDLLKAKVFIDFELKRLGAQ